MVHSRLHESLASMLHAARYTQTHVEGCRSDLLKQLDSLPTGAASLLLAFQSFGNPHVRWNKARMHPNDIRISSDIFPGISAIFSRHIHRQTCSQIRVYLVRAATWPQENSYLGRIHTKYSSQKWLPDMHSLRHKTFQPVDSLAAFINSSCFLRSSSRTLRWASTCSWRLLIASAARSSFVKNFGCTHVTAGIKKNNY